MTSLFRANASIGKFIVLEKQVGRRERGVLEERIYILPNAQRESLDRLALPVAAPTPRHATPCHAMPRRAVPRGSANEPARERRRRRRQTAWLWSHQPFLPRLSVHSCCQGRTRGPREFSCRGWPETVYPTVRYKPPYCVPLSSAKPEQRHAISLNRSRIGPVDSSRRFERPSPPSRTNATVIGRKLRCRKRIQESYKCIG